MPGAGQPDMAQETTAKYTLRKAGRPYTADYRVWFEHEHRPVSPFHDIPLFADRARGILNMVVEIPRWTNAKFEITRDECINPIHQDVKNGRPRFSNNCFPYRGYLWNYGAFPQTWEDPHHVHPDTGEKGDNDPLDVVEIGRAVAHTGEVKRVKVLGVLPLLDGGETDWKVVAVDVRDPLAAQLRDIGDVARYCPGLLEATRDWFRIYKVPDGHAPNRFALGGAFQDKHYARRVIQDCEAAWRRLVRGRAPPGTISIVNTTLDGTPGKVNPDDVKLPPHEERPPAKIKQDMDEWFFVDRDALDGEDEWVIV